MLFRDLRSAGVLLLLALGLASCGGGSSTSSKAAGKTVTATAAGTASATTTRGATSPGGSTAGRSHLPEGPNHRGAAAHSTTAAHPSRASSAAGSAQFKRALSSFAACLSRNGVKLPAGGSGAAPALSLKGVDTKSAAYQKALKACVPVINAALKSATKARPGSTSSSSSGAGSATGGSSGASKSPGLGSVKVPASVTAGFERFTACMRSNGVPGFPEPTGASFDLSGTNLNPHSPQYKAAEAKCNPILMAVDR